MKDPKASPPLSLIAEAEEEGHKATCLADNWFEALFLLCPCLVSSCLLSRRLNLSPLSWFSVGSLSLGEARAELM